MSPKIGALPPHQRKGNAYLRSLFGDAKRTSVHSAFPLSTHSLRFRFVDASPYAY